MAHRLAPQARNDLDDIWDYVSRESGSDATADRAVDAVANRFHLLARWPRLGRARDDLRRGLRSHAVGEYVIIYRIEDDDVVIQRVVKGRRDIDTLFNH